MQNGVSLTNAEQVLPWMPEQPFDVVSFDCDATLSELEGINVLANQNGVGEEVARLTHVAMRESGLKPSIYRERLDLIRPTQEQVMALGELYFSKKTPDVEAVIRILQSLNKRVTVLSAGLLPCVQLFANKLQIPSNQVHAVDCFFDADGQYHSYDDKSLLIQKKGKAVLLKQLCDDSERVVHIGDGMNDVVTVGHVELFIGFGGGSLHEHIERLSDVYVIANTFSAFLPLILTMDEVTHLEPPAYALFEKGCHAVLARQVLREGKAIHDHHTHTE